MAMKKIVIAVIVMILLSLSATAKPRVSYISDFSTNTDQWVVYEDAMITHDSGIVGHRAGSLLIEKASTNVYRHPTLRSDIVCKPGAEINLTAEFWAQSINNNYIEVQMGSGPYRVYEGQWQAISFTARDVDGLLWLYAKMNYGDKLWMRNVIVIELDRAALKPEKIKPPKVLKDQVDLTDTQFRWGVGESGGMSYVSDGERLRIIGEEDASTIAFVDDVIDVGAAYRFEFELRVRKGTVHTMQVGYYDYETGSCVVVDEFDIESAITNITTSTVIASPYRGIFVRVDGIDFDVALIPFRVWKINKKGH